MSTNPLKQYFRRPALYIRLPSLGKYYSPEVLVADPSGEIPVYPMTAIDEITVKTPDALFNGTAVVSVIQSCVPNIKNAWEINTIDMETILIAIRVATGGEQMSMNSVCPNCETEGSYDVDLIRLLQTQRSVDFDQPLILNDLKIQFRPLNYSEINQNGIHQYEIQRAIAQLSESENLEQAQSQINDYISKFNKLMNDLIADTIASITTPEEIVTDRLYIQEFLRETDRRSFNAIKDYSVRLKSENAIRPLHIKCGNCQHEYDQQIVLNMSDFFE